VHDRRRIVVVAFLRYERAEVFSHPLTPLGPVLSRR
jgi:hypothetical protein